MDVVDNGEARVVAGANRVGRCQHGGARVQRGNDARLGNRHRLLLHHLVQLHRRSAVLEQARRFHVALASAHSSVQLTRCSYDSTSWLLPAVRGCLEASHASTRLLTPFQTGVADSATAWRVVGLTMERAESDILSNSSMQQMPRSDSTSAPLSSTISRVSWSRAT